MTFIAHFPEKFVGQDFRIDCHEIEIYGAENNPKPMFKGPGVIESKKAGRFSFKLYNLIESSEEQFLLLKEFLSNSSEGSIPVTLIANDYSGIRWVGGWSYPQIPFHHLVNSGQFMVYGKFDQLSTRLKKVEGDDKKNITEIIFAEKLDMPYDRCFREVTYRGEEEVYKKWQMRYHDLDFKGSKITFEEKGEIVRTHIRAYNRESFGPPYVENWIGEALRFVTAQLHYPRMVIRHFEEDALIFLRETYEDSKTKMTPPFPNRRDLKQSIWEVFGLYLSLCERKQSFEPLEISQAFKELISSSTATVQGFLITLAWYVECITRQIANSKGWNKHEAISDDALGDLKKYIENWEHYKLIENRMGIFDNLKNSPMSKLLDHLVREDVIQPIHKRAWRETRHRLMHGTLASLNKEKHWQYANHLISVAYRISLRLLGYKGKTLHFDDTSFQIIDFDWKGENIIKAQDGQDKELPKKRTMNNPLSPDEELALAQEINLGLYLIEFGLFTLNRIQNVEHLPLLLLSSGIERILKLIIIFDFFKTEGRFPEEKEYYENNLKTHDLCFLLDEVLKISDQRQYCESGNEAQVDLSFLRSAQKNSLKEILRIFSEYANQGRYHNLNVLVQVSRSTEDPTQVFECYRNRLIKEISRTCDFSDCKIPEQKIFKAESIANEQITELLQKFTRALCRLMHWEMPAKLADEMILLLSDFLELKDNDLRSIRFDWLPDSGSNLA